MSPKYWKKLVTNREIYFTVTLLISHHYMSLTWNGLIKAQTWIIKSFKKLFITISSSLLIIPLSWWKLRVRFCQHYISTFFFFLHFKELWKTDFFSVESYINVILPNWYSSHLIRERCCLHDKIYQRLTIWFSPNLGITSRLIW